MIRLEPEKRAALSRALQEARDARGWNQEATAEAATAALRVAAAEERGASPEERALWAEIEITRHHVSKMENFPAGPLGTLERRSCLLGLTLALGLDRGEINRLAGGL